MINDKREKNNKEKMTIKFLLPNNYNYMIMMKENKTIKKKIKILLPNNNYNYMINNEREKKQIEKK